MFCTIARMLPEEAPFAFGMNLREDGETLKTLNRISTVSEVWKERPAGPRPLMVLVSDNQSFIDQYLVNFLGSLAAVSPGLHVHIHFCDPLHQPKQRLKTAKSGNPKLEISGS